MRKRLHESKKSMKKATAVNVGNCCSSSDRKFWNFGIE